jgi:CRISPR-associated endonuclease/helicase Cas3
MKDCLKLFTIVKLFKQQTAVRIAERAHIEVKDLWDSAFFTLILHDIGKASIPFQEYIRGKREMESHAFLSFYIANQICSASKLKLNNEPAGLEALAIASHHSPLHPSKFKTMYKEDQEDPQVLRDVVMRYLEHFASGRTMEYIGKSLPRNVSFPETYDEIYESFTLLNTRLRRSPMISNNSIRLPFAFLKGILHYCDWYGSGKEFNPRYSPNNVEIRVLEYLEKKERKPIKFNKFQEDSKLADDAILRAPTGTGKTEAALLWAGKHTSSKKLLYLLPTMTTSNKMFDRLKETLGCEVGLLHGTSDYMLRANEECEEQEEFEHVRRSLFCKSFMYPCTVATIDQLLFTMFNWGRWELKLMNAGNSAIIIDEIHAYEPYTVALIVETLKALQSLGAKCFIMSATIPTVLGRFLANELKLGEIRRDTAYDRLVRTTIRLQLDKTISSALPEILHYYRHKKKILVICNTVATSKAIFQTLRSEKEVRRNRRILLHSQFIMRDRATKEDLLEKLRKKRGPFILVATQVVEVSLDIDFDILFTEACPIDALIQRLGRVNRRGERPPAPVFIYRQTPNADRVYDPELVRDSVEQLCSKGRDELKELELMEIVDDIYNGIDYESKFQRELRKTRILIADVQDNLRYVYRLTVEEKTLQQVVTRESDYVTINVIPRDFADKALGLPKNERYRRVEFTVKVPYYRIKENLRQPLDGVLVADVGYDPQLGVIFPEKETEAFIY